MKCCDITPGQMRHTIELQSQTEVPDGYGGVELDWGDAYATPKAKIKALSGQQRLMADGLANPVKYRAYIRYRDDVLPAHRVVYNGKTFDIKAVYDVEERRRFLELELTEGVAA